MNAPAFVLRIPLEGAPVVYLDALREGERDRLLDWIRADDGRAELVARAVELAERKPAA